MPHSTARGFPRARFALAAALWLGAIFSVARAAETVPSLVEKYCLDCHDSDHKKSDLSFEALDKSNFAAAPDAWEKVIRKLDHRLMPPIGEARPDDTTYNQIVALLS